MIFCMKIVCHLKKETDRVELFLQDLGLRFFGCKKGLKLAGNEDFQVLGKFDSQNFY